MKKLLFILTLLFSTTAYADGIDAQNVLNPHCDGTDASTSFPDASTANPKTITANGNGQVDTAQKKFGTGSYLGDGNLDYLSVPTSTDFNFGTADFTIDFWVRFNAGPGVNMDMVNRGNPITDSLDIAIRVNNSNNVLVYLMGGLLFNTGWAFNQAQWYHVALSRSGTNLRLFIDGTQLGSTVTNSTDVTSSEDLFLGASPFLASNSLNGWMDEIRFSKGIARWTADFTPPTEAYSAAGGGAKNLATLGVG